MTQFVDVLAQALVPIMRILADNMQEIFDVIVAVGAAITTYIIGILARGGIVALIRSDTIC